MINANQYGIFAELYTIKIQETFYNFVREKKYYGQQRQLQVPADRALPVRLGSKAGHQKQ
jgi:hypothetical protein